MSEQQEGMHIKRVLCDYVCNLQQIVVFTTAKSSQKYVHKKRNSGVKRTRPIIKLNFSLVVRWRFGNSYMAYRYLVMGDRKSLYVFVVLMSLIYPYKPKSDASQILYHSCMWFMS